MLFGYQAADAVTTPVTLMYALNFASKTHIDCGNYATATAHLDELVASADDKGAPLFKAIGMASRGVVLAALSE
jgi:hypothetical protein